MKKPQQQYQIDKLILRDSGMTINYTLKRGEDTISLELKSKDAPRPELKMALLSLLHDVIEICDLPTTYTKQCEVRGVTIIHKDDGRLGATISVLKTVSRTSAVFNIHSPYAEERTEEGEEQGFRAATVKRLKNLMEEANRYLNGERAQQGLSFNESSVGDHGRDGEFANKISDVV